MPQPLHLRDYGGGPRRVLAFHCSLAHAGTWRGLAHEMADEITLTGPDMLSHGKSPDWDGTGRFQDNMVAAGAALLTRPMDVIGHSFGGAIALRLAAQKPEMVRSLILYEPILFGIAEQDAPHLAQADRDSMRPVRAALEADNPMDAARHFNQLWGEPGGPEWSEMRAPTRAAMARAVSFFPATLDDIYGNPGRILDSGALDRVAMPVLLLNGAMSPDIVKCVSLGLVARLPDAVSQELDGAGHMGPISKPACVADAIRSFWSRP